MWTKGTVKAGNSEFRFWVKHYEEPSEEYGIHGGRISKLMLKRNGKVVCSYEREPEIAPADEDTELAFEALLEKFN